MRALPALRRVVVAIVVFALTAEVLALAHFYWDTGHLFYLYRKPYEPIPQTGRQRLTGDALHPYFGPTHKPGLPFDIPDSLRRAGAAPAALRTNNFGFVATSDYPFIKANDRQVVIGVFGGSVGVWFCHVGVPALLDALRRDPRYQDRDLVPLCFSHEGYKQPQQLQVLSYFLSVGQRFDAIVNIDGFNEVALGHINASRGFDISMPSAPHLEPLVNLVDSATLGREKLETLASIVRDRDTLTNLVQRMSAARSAFVHFVEERMYEMVRNRYRTALVTFGELPSVPSDASLVHITPPTRRRDGDALFDDIASNWARASVLMHDLARAHGAAYVHVLQPNQYFTARRFGADEARVAINAASPFKPGAERGYPRLLAAAPTLQASGVRFVDGTGLFDPEPAPVYIDDCCHYTRRGYELVADAVAAAVLRDAADAERLGRRLP